MINRSRLKIYFLIIKNLIKKIKGVFLIPLRLIALSLRPLTPKEKEFINENSIFWRQYGRFNSSNSSGYVFVLPEMYPLILVGNSQISAFIASQKNARLLFLLPSYFNYSMRKVLSSFGGTTFLYEDTLRYSIYKIISFFDSVIFLKKIKSPEDLLEFKIDGVQFGDLMYDSFLSCGYATLDDIHNPELFNVINRFFYNLRVIKDIIKRFRIKIALVGHIGGSYGGTYTRCLLQAGIEVWERCSTIKKYRYNEETYGTSIAPDKRYFEIMKNNKSFFLPLAEKAVNERLGSKNTAFQSQRPYLESKRIFNSREEFGSFFKLDSKKKNIFVMLHGFNDMPHLGGFSIYRDYYVWFKEVLEVAKLNQSVNWIFKEHPYAYYYPCKDIKLSDIFSISAFPHILFLEKDANFNTGSLGYIADVILTCMGTAGLEYATFGVPSILAGRPWYSGFGFTLEPKTDAEFKEILMHIDKVQRLDAEQITLAKLAAFFTFEVVEVTKFRDPFRTICTYNYEEIISFTSEQMFKNFIKYRNESSEEEKTNYSKALNEFIANPGYVQFVDLDRFPCFKEAVIS